METKEQILKTLMEINYPEGIKEEDVPIIYISSEFEGYQDAVQSLIIDLLRALGREDIKVCPQEDEDDYYSGEMLIPLEEYAGHNYPINEPCIIVNNGYQALRMDGTVGNALPGRNSGVIRKATKEEIEKFVNNYTGKPFVFF